MLTSSVEQELGRKVEELRRELDEAHRREAATAEVLRVISRSVGEAKPVFDVIAGSALSLVNAQHVGVVLYDGEVLHLAALHNSTPEAAEAIRRSFPRQPDDSSSVGRAFRFREPVQIRGREGLNPRRRISEDTAQAVDDILELLLLIGFLDPGALKWA
jgi:hypothetical protein